MTILSILAKADVSHEDMLGNGDKGNEPSLNMISLGNCQDNVMTTAGDFLFETPCTMFLHPKSGTVSFSNDSLIVDVDEDVSFSVVHNNVAVKITRSVSQSKTKVASAERVFVSNADKSLVVIGNRMTVEDSLDIGSGGCDGLPICQLTLSSCC